ncbi:MAG: TetR/AcrR family transcriptional regulator [Myxococcota bacterium]
MARPRASADDVKLRERLLLAAEELLRTTPFEELSLREVARRAGVSHAAPYNHFPSKDHLILALAQRAAHLLDQAMHEAMAAAPDNPADQLVASGVGYVLFARRHPALFDIIFHHEPPEGCGPLEEMDPAFQRLLRAVTNLGARPPTDAQGILSDAVFAWVHVHGLAVMFIHGTLNRVPFDEVALAREHCRRLLQVLAPQLAT